MSRIYIGNTGNNGLGIFANQKHEKDQTLFTLKGRARRASYGPDYRVGPRWVGIDQRTWLVVPRSNYAYYINHCCEPNCGLKDRKVVAMRTIEVNEEITIDYSITEADPYWRMKCKCGKPRCRKIIRSIQFLPEEIYRNYEQFVSKPMRLIRMKMRRFNSQRF